MNGLVVIGVLLALPPAAAAWKRQWIAVAIYLVGWLFYIQTATDSRDGWGDLAAIVSLVVLILPIYAVASIVWVVLWWRRKKGKTGRIG